jgi:hypothetical protein
VHDTVVGAVFRSSEGFGPHADVFEASHYGVIISVGRYNMLWHPEPPALVTPRNVDHEFTVSILMRQQRSSAAAQANGSVQCCSANDESSTSSKVGQLR